MKQLDRDIDIWTRKTDAAWTTWQKTPPVWRAMAEKFYNDARKETENLLAERTKLLAGLQGKSRSAAACHVHWSDSFGIWMAIALGGRECLCR